MNMAREGEDFREQRLKEIHTPGPKRLKLPHWTNPFCRKTHAMQGPMPESTASDSVDRNLKKIGVAGCENFELSIQNSNAHQSSMYNLNREFQGQTNNSTPNPSSALEDYFDRSKNKTDQPFVSLTPTKVQENFNFCNFITQKQSSDHHIKQGMINYKPQFQKQFQSAILESSQTKNSADHNMCVEHISSNAADETILQNLEYEEEPSFGSK